MNSRNPLIFIVDDDPIYHKIIKNVLKNNNLTNVQTYFSGEECLADINQNPSFVFLDYNMEGLTGIEVLQKIKAINPDTKVVMVSGQEKIEVALKAIKLGAHDYVVKDKKVLNRLKEILFLNNNELATIN